MVRRALVIVLFTALVLGGAAHGPVRDAHAAARLGTTDQLTILPDLRTVRFGKAVTVRGLLTRGGAPVGGAPVLVHRLGTTTGTAVVTDAQGRYTAAVRPRSNARWVASSGDLESKATLIRVAPKVTLSLSHRKKAKRLVEYFRGSVAPRHAGSSMKVQRWTRSGWRAVASGRLDARSRYTIAWVLPRGSATYRLRVILPAHEDHARGTSLPVTLQVVAGRG